MVDVLQQPAPIAPQDLQPVNPFAGAAVATAETDREDEVVRGLVQEFNWFRRERQANYDPLFNECYRLYRTQMPDERRSGEWRSKIHVPYAFTNVEELLPHLMAGLFTSEKLVRIQSKVDPSMAEANEDIIMHQLEEQMNIESGWEEHQKQKLIYGSSPIYVGFKITSSTKKMWQKQQSSLDPSQHEMVVVEQTLPDYIGNFMEVIDIREMFPHPESTMDNPIKQFRQQYRTKDWMLKVGKFKNLDKINDELKTSSNKFNDYPDYREQSFGTANNQPRPTTVTPVYRIVTCYDDVQKKVFTYVEDQVLIQEDDYPFWHGKSPIVWDRHVIVPKEFYGMGVIEPTIALQHEGNTIRNQRRDNISLILNPIMSVVEGSVQDEQTELKSRPGQVIHPAAQGDVEWLQPPMVTQEALIEARQVKSDISEVNGTTPALSGTPVTDTSSGNSLMQKASILRLQQSIRRGANCFKEMVWQMVSNNAQFFPLDEVKDYLTPILAKTYQDMPPATLSTRCVISIKPAGIYGDDNLDFQQLVNFVNVLQSSAAIAPDVNFVYLAELMFKKKNIDPALALKQGSSVDVMEMQFAMEENQMILAGQQVPPATPDENYDLHTAMHKMVLQHNPNAFQAIGAHLVTHEQAKVQRTMMLQQAQGAAGPNGPGSAPAGARGGLNPARQPQATDATGQARQAARMVPRK